ncbi:hypothetical protein WG66_012452 [Moniliophthora roreri]|nr:hypothetical protein WG66_012452 [Moniliophthora roreri]
MFSVSVRCSGIKSGESFRALHCERKRLAIRSNRAVSGWSLLGYNA